MPVWEQRWESTTAAGGSPVAARELTDGSVLITAAAGSGIVAARYDHSGGLLSSAIIRAPYLDWLPSETQTRCFIDPFGGVFVSAVSDVSLTRGDIWLMKYDGFTGKAAWAAPGIFDGATHQLDVPVRVLIDQRGDAILVGSSRNGGSRDAVLLKYEGVSGVPLWGPTLVAGLNGPVSALDPAGGVILSGSRRTSTSYDRTETYRFDGQTGNMVWGPAIIVGLTSSVTPRAIAAGPDGYAVLAASTVQGVTTLHKYAGPSGAVIWGPVSFSAGVPPAPPRRA